MTVRLGIFVATALCLTASSVLADEVLYCTDTDATGFEWDAKGNVSQRSFVLERFTVTVTSDTERVITPRIGGSAGTALWFGCTHPLPSMLADRIVCDVAGGGEQWMFFHNTYTRTFLAGPPAGGIDPNIWIAYGNCTKF
jgi:hypothetical protein